MDKAPNRDDMHTRLEESEATLSTPEWQEQDKFFLPHPLARIFAR